MTRPTEYPENLAVRARRGSLSAEQQQQLERLTSTSAALRAAYVFGRDFDNIGTVQPGDEACVERFVDGALSARHRIRTRGAFPKGLTAWLLAAAVFGFCGLAFGLRGLWFPKFVVLQGPPVPPQASPSEVPKAARPRQMSSEPRDVTSAVTTASEADDSVSPIQARSNSPDGVVRSTPKAIGSGSALLSSAAALPNESEILGPPPGAGVPGVEASSLLRQANAARRLGHIDEAIALLQTLQRDFPGSREAGLSHVSLGKLYMSRGVAGTAAQEFSTYISSGGPLSEEALLGRAQALAVLGRHIEERQTWELLLVRFPYSVYATEARSRISTLGREPLE